ncbi:YihY/virulence factor BrkB family protein [Halobacillus sp. A1]|uniref:YihY/virulence factor BrkB family protein n=1 Tax=Halobacillus sp. A1 TaxID=2880262 RepID=UPI0020A671F7|nr:YihY/virulence factor BrkB family protein [Halobacillus sp. A1]MCP3030839.1 YihY/virulence factor BrkB family protein [Halobacillus sp. A1]
MKKLINYAKEVFAEFQKDNVPLLGAAQAYYYLLAIFPLVILLLSILPYLNISAEEAMNFMQNILPGGAADIFQENIVNLVETPNGGLLTVGILGTLWSASNGVNAFIQASNIAYNVEETRSFIKVRLMSIFLTIGMIIAIAVALALPIFGDVIISMLSDFLNLPAQTIGLFQVLRWVISIFVMSLTLMALYHFAPNKSFPFKEILPGAIITAILWQLISLAFSFYVSNFANYSATYGSLGGIIILMLWFFITGIILMVGAELNVVRHRKKKERARQVA